MNHQKWEAYLSICRKVESAGRGDDGHEDPESMALWRAFLAQFMAFLKPPARVLAPGAIAEALMLAEAGYETHALVLGPDNVKWLEERRQGLSKPDLLHIRELDAHDLDYPANFFDGYFTVQVNEHWLSWFIHLGEVRATSKDGAICFVDACGTTNTACKMVWHTNLVPEKTVLEQWEFWGFEEVWRGSQGDDRPQFVFKMRGIDDPAFPNAGYLKWILRLRNGEQIKYDYDCEECRRG